MALFLNKFKQLFTAYPNPYMVYNGSRYYKHIYVGSERIVSKVSVNNPDYDPRQEDCAGNEITGYNVKLHSRQHALSDSIASIYAKFEVPYYPNNNDDYGYNWSDGLRRSVPNPDGYGELAYFYHSDHLGSTSYVTDANGEVSQHVEYVPFGEIFIEELSSSAKLNTPFLFNGKELDEETGLYYYGARYYDPRTSLWLSTDPMELKYPGISSYAYCSNNPVKLVDVEGERPTPHEAALMAKHVYNDIDATDILKNLNDYGWVVSSFETEITKNYTKWYQNGLQSQIYERTIDGKTEYAYVFAGTNSIEDGLEDIAQVFGVAPQYYTAISNARTLSEELGTRELTFIGHSLGGGEAAAASMATQRAAITFNPAAVSNMTSLFGKLGSASNVTNYIMVGEQIFNSSNLMFGGDPLNNLQRNIGLDVPGRIIPVKIGYSIQHSIDEFIKLDLPE